MARQPYFVNTTTKTLDVEMSYAGGMDSQSHPEKLRDDQSVLIENADIVAGGVLQGRGAYAQSNIPSSPISGNTQGRFHYKNAAGGQELIAINGKLYKVDGNSYTQIPITNLTQFQTVRTIGATQYRDDMYIATGSGLVKYDGVNATLVAAYAPNGLEALYIGTNGYAANPDAYLSDTTGNADLILGLMPDQRYGVVNKTITFTAYIEQVSGDVLEYLWESKLTTDADFAVLLDWGTNKSWTGAFGTKGDYVIRVSLRKQGTTTVLSQYVLPKYKVNTTPDEKPEPSVNFDDMKTCNRIFVHYDRLCLYGDQNFPDHLYVSHLNNFAYFPRTNITPIVDPERGNLQSVVRYKDFLVCFTNGSIQMITGTEPNKFDISPIHTTLGTKWGDSPQIIQNVIVFVGNDNGLYIIRSYTYASDDKLNVQRIDDTIKDVVVGLIKTSTNILSCIYNNQYFLYIENSGGNYIYRYYFELGLWVRDSISLSFKTLDTLENVVNATSPTGGVVYQLDNTKYKDGVNTTFNVKVTSKDYDFGMPHHRKKLKQYQILAKMTSATTINVSIYLDNNLLSTTSLAYDSMQNTDAQKLKISATGRFRYVKTDVEIPVNEMIQLIGFGFVYKLNTPK